MNNPRSPGLYCIPCCIPAIRVLSGLALPWPWPGVARAAAEAGAGPAGGGGGPAGTPRGGSNRRPGAGLAVGGPHHARESKTLALHPDAVGLSVGHIAAAFNDYGAGQ